jgi:diguanylate cyclase (GGDEF)-like protein/PAS domain S-box-containing protein
VLLTGSLLAIPDGLIRIAGAMILGLSGLGLTLVVIAAVVAVVIVLLGINRRSNRNQEDDATLSNRKDDRYALAVMAANDGIWDWDLDSGEVFFCPRWQAMLGLESTDLEPRIETWLDLVHGDDREQLEAALSAHLEDYTSLFDGVHRVRHKNGSYRWMRTRARCYRSSCGKAQRVVGIMRDVTEQRLAEEQLTHDALHDQLTGLPNRILFLDRLGGAIARSQRHPGYLYSVLFMDLDRFKAINDRYGHAIGDTLLKKIGARITGCLRPVDTVARLSGDEFAILLDGIDQIDNATELASRVLEQISRPFDLDGNEIFTTASIGIATSKTGYRSPEDVLRDADTAMYRAKNLGKARHQVFDTSMHARAMKRIMLETKLRQAVRSQQLLLYYQPIVALHDRSMSGIEALLRWNHPVRGLVPVKDFLPLAEETGLIVSIGVWVLEEACKQLVSLHQLADHLTMSVNLSSRELVHSDFLPQLREVLSRTGIEPRHLRLEIREEILLEDDETVGETFATLNELGVDLDLDGFGNGCSSLTCLARRPIRRLKVDQRLIGTMLHDARSMDMVRAILDLSRSLSIEVVAKGIEKPGQAEQLQQMGCGLGQGYLFSKPLSATELRHHVATA